MILRAPSTKNKRSQFVSTTAHPPQHRQLMTECRVPIALDWERSGEVRPSATLRAMLHCLNE
jgi:hypothetical protein